MFTNTLAQAETRYRFAEAAVRSVRAKVAAYELRAESRALIAMARRHGHALPILEQERRATAELGAARRALDLARAGVDPTRAEAA